MRLISWMTQVVAITVMNLRTVGQRKGSSVAAAFGVAGVVAVFVGVLSMAAGIEATMVDAGARDVALVMRGGADTEMTSILGLNETRIIQDAPGIVRNGPQPVASAELFVMVDLPKRSTHTDANVPLRGVQPGAFQVRRDVRITAGRMFEWGRNEVIAGVGATREFTGLEVGRELTLGDSQWKIVGEFTAGGSVYESEIWSDAQVLQPVYRRGSSYQSVFARLESPERFDTFKNALTSDPRLNVKVIRERDYYAEQSTLLRNLITGLGTLVAGLMGAGAIFGALNTMYTAVSARTREIATLRALGFGGGPIVISVLVESMLLAAAGGLLGGGAAYLAFDGFTAATMNWQSFSQVAFAFAVTPQLLARGVFYALVIGLLGGLFPAVRAARLSVATALRQP